MQRIYTIGETVYDIIFKDEEPVTAKAGGTMLNTAVSLGRLSLPVSFISEYGVDHAGDIINGFLEKNGVDTSLVYRYKEGKTAISLAFLNELNDAQYTFYKHYPEKRLPLDLPAFSRGDILLFGGFYSLMPEVRSSLISFVKAAKAAGALIIYDPNIRSPHKNEITALRELIYENLSLAELVRGSDEDFKTIFDIPTGRMAYDIVNSYGCNYLVYTKSNVGVEFYYPGGVIDVEVPPVTTVSTIGAGDSFNAGLIYEFFKLKKLSKTFSSQEFAKSIKTAISFGSHVCTHYENYISESFAEKYSD
ncbi:MAG: carbohydrate kinase [Bacteroidota bacterium]